MTTRRAERGSDPDSKRALSEGAGAPQPEIRAQYGCYQLELPVEPWVDVEAAKASCDEGEGALRRSDVSAAWGRFNVTVAVARRGFLPGEAAAWAEERRRELQRLLARGLDGYALRALLREELGVSPSEETTALFTRILREPPPPP
jgi:hypothetical protein